MEQYSKQKPEDYLNLDENKIDSKKGRLKIFLGMSAGVGKTYAMLSQAFELQKQGKNILIGIVETHSRKDTEEKLNGLNIVPLKKIEYRSISLFEPDIETIINLKPDFVLIDELAHTNAPGSKHNKRYQDVQELLNAGINVYSTLNVQHIESQSDHIGEITGINISETIPDSIIDLADEIELIDIPTEDLLQRLKEGKIYAKDKAEKSANNFFRKGNLTALREISLRLAADRVDNDLRSYMKSNNIEGPWKTKDRLLVAVGPGPYSAKLIKITRKKAFSMGADWIAAYIDTDRKLSESENENLKKNLNLAIELGAHVENISESNVIDGILKICQRNNVSQIIVGKSLDSPLKNFLKGGSITDKLIRESGSIDVFVVQAEKNPKVNKRKSFLLNKSFFSQLEKRDFYLSALFVVTIAAICFPFTDIIGYQTVGLILLLGISFQSLFLGRAAIFFSAFLNAIIWNYFFIPPILTFHIDKVNDIITLIANFVIAIFMAVLITRIRKSEKFAKNREERNFKLYNFSKAINNANSISNLIDIVKEEFQKQLKIPITIQIPDEFINLLDFKNDHILDSKEKSVADWVMKNQKSAGKMTNTLNQSNFTFYPLVTNRSLVGVIGLELNIKNEDFIEKEFIINSYLGMIASALEREILNKKAAIQNLNIESDKLFQTLINSISHEMKIPISVIQSATQLIESDIDSNTLMVIKKDLTDAGNRINLLISNFLDISRIESGFLVPKFQITDPIDIINSAIHEIDNHQINIHVKNECINTFINADFKLLEQSLLNIIQNAIKYAKNNIYLEIKTVQKQLEILIFDDGNGINNENLTRIFEKFYRVPGSSTGGIGLGLSISKSLIELHNGTIVAFNHPVSSGLAFKIILPIFTKNQSI